MELILYAEPGGALGARCTEYWASVSAAEATTSAQEFPPHVSLTGFFHRPHDRVAEVTAAFAAALDAAAPAGLDGIRWVGPVALEFQANDTWIGLHVEAPWMDAVIAAFVAACPQVAGDDPVRPKSWLHVSLSYGEQFEWACAAAETAAVQAGFADLAGESDWSVSLWHRDGSHWERLVSEPVRAGSD